jgi:nucleoside-diphosphate-sugar epimerase
MATVLIDRAGFIGRRLIPILAKQGAEVVCMDISPSAASFENGVRIGRADVAQLDEVVAVVSETKPLSLL